MIKVQKQKINVSKQNRNLLKKKIGAVVNFIIFINNLMID